MVRNHSRWFLRNLALDRNVVAAGSDCGVRAVRKEPGMTVCFTGDITARSSGWQYGLRQMAVGKQSCAKSSPSSKTTAATSPPPATALLRRELATQIEQELLRFADPDKQAVLIIALKHLDPL